MTEQRRQVCTELARRMGWTLEADGYWQSWRSLDGSTRRNVRPSYGESPIGDPFTDAADNRALIEWLAADDARWTVFYAWFVVERLSLHPDSDSPIAVVREVMTASYEVVTLAACKALGIGEAGG